MAAVPAPSNGTHTNGSLPTASRQWLIAEYPPTENIDVSKVFTLQTVPFPSPSEASRSGKILVKTLYLSNDPAQRTWIGDFDPKKHYMQPIRKGDKMLAFAVGKVLESYHDKFSKGDIVTGLLGWQDVGLVDVEIYSQGPFPLQKLPQGLDPTEVLCGVTGMTAYFGLLEVLKATKDDKVLIVTGAAGATGSAVSQIAKKVLGIEYVVGIAGSDEKCRVCEDVGGCDLALNYKTPGWEQKLANAVNERGGADLFFDNVGGKILDFVLDNCMKKYGRIAACGAISGYDSHSSGGISHKAWGKIIQLQLNVRGFLLTTFKPQMPKAQMELMGWMKEGKYRSLKQVWEADFDQVPNGMVKLLQGFNTGKLITKICD